MNGFSKRNDFEEFKVIIISGITFGTFIYSEEIRADDVDSGDAGKFVVNAVFH